AGEVVVAVGRAGVCGTDMEFYTGEMAYLHSGHEHYPVRIGHEWMGTVRSVGDGVTADLLGRRVTGDTMLGCGRCRRCMRGRQHVCDDRFELGIRGGRPGALAEYVAVPATSLPRSAPGTGYSSPGPAPSACSARCSRAATAPRSTCWAG